MKKLITALLLLTSPVFAAHITHTDYTSNTTITASGQNTNENAIVNEMNGNLDSTNIAEGAITTSKLDSTVQAAFVPTGSFFYWVGSTNSVPTGYLYTNGAAVSRTTYAALFNVIGVTFGQGNGSTTFNLPDTRGYFVRGVDDAAGRDTNAATRTAAATGGNTGDNIGSVEVSSVGIHTHVVNVTDPGHRHSVLDNSGASGVVFPGSSEGSSFAALNSLSAASYDDIANRASLPYIQNNTTGITATTSNNSGTETRPININMGGIIKY